MTRDEEDQLYELWEMDPDFEYLRAWVNEVVEDHSGHAYDQGRRDERDGEPI